jgi:hypothetical protein
MTDHDELREKVAVAIMQSGAGPTYGDTLRTMADAAIAVVLEEAAKVADYKAGSLTQSRDTHAMVQGVMAEDIAAAIRAMIKEG